MTAEPVPRRPRVDSGRSSGFASRRVRDLLGSLLPVDDFTVSSVHRSPIGPLAVAVRVEDTSSRTAARDRTRQVAAAVSAEPWVTEVGERSPSVYLHVDEDVLRVWAAEAFRPGAPLTCPAPAASRQRVELQVAEPPGGTAGLAWARAARVARAVGGVLRARGYDVRSLGDAGDRRLVVTTSGRPADAETILVGPVDVPQGALVAGHGGLLLADDVVGELRARLLRRWSAVLDVADPFDWCGRYAEATLGYLLLRAPRRSHARLGEAELFGAPAAAFDDTVATRAWLSAEGIPGRPGDPGGNRALLMLLDTVPGAVAQAAKQYDTEPLIRFLAQLVERARHAGDLRPGDPARPAVAVVIAGVLDLLGVMPPEPVDPRLFERTAR